jgi:imidazolonepropionase-like amidohydrolase
MSNFVVRSHRFNSVLRSLFVLCALLVFAGVVLAQSGGLALTHVTIIDPGVDKPQQDMTILVRGHDIAAVGRAKQVTIHTSVKVIDGTGKFVIPGLWDMHSHFRDAGRDLKMDIANEVLGTRNMGGATKEVFPLRDAIAHGQQVGPKIVACGPIVDGPNSWSNPKFTISVTATDEARAAVVSLKQQGTDCIKVYDGLSRDSYFAILDQAKKLDLPVVGHLPSAVSIREASDAGQRSLEHSIALAGGSTMESEYIKRRLDQSDFQEALRTKNFALIPAKIARDNTMMLDTFSQERADATYRMLAKNNTFITPTLVTERSLTFIDDLNARPDPRTKYVSAEELHGGNQRTAC